MDETGALAKEEAKRVDRVAERARLSMMFSTNRNSDSVVEDCEGSESETSTGSGL